MADCSGDWSWDWRWVRNASLFIKIYVPIRYVWWKTRDEEKQKCKIFIDSPSHQLVINSCSLKLDTVIIKHWFLWVDLNNGLGHTKLNVSGIPYRSHYSVQMISCMFCELGIRIYLSFRGNLLLNAFDRLCLQSFPFIWSFVRIYIDKCLRHVIFMLRKWALYYL